MCIRDSNEASLSLIEQAFSLERDGQGVLLGSEDFAEGTAAFQAKRDASFRGR